MQVPFRTVLAAFLGLALLLLTTPSQADHAIAMHGTPKYAADFLHLDYVNPEAPKGGVLKMSKSGSFDNLNNHVITGNNVEGLEYINDKLMQRVWNEPFTMYGLVAESIDVAPDRSWIVFHLRKEAKFHDGKPMTTDDVQYSYEMYRKHGHPVRRRVYGLIEEVEITDPHTIKFTFGKGFDRESVMILAMMPVLPKHYWEKADVSKTTLTPPLGSGPYKITSVEPGRKIVYERVKDWWAKDLPVNKGLYNFDTITYTYFRDDDIALQSFNAGEYNFRREYDVTKWHTGYNDKPDIVKETISHGRPEWLKALIFNTRRPHLSDAKVREALSYMFNDEWLNKTLYFGELKKISSAFPNSELAASGVPQGEELDILEEFKKDLPPQVFGEAYQSPSGNVRDNQRKAIALLKEAGWTYKKQKLQNAKGEGMLLEILLSDPNEEKIALEFSRSLKKIGVDVRVRTVDSAQFTGRLEDFDYDIVLFRWINSLSPGNEQVNYWGKVSAVTNGARNYAGIRNDSIDSIADSIARSTTREGLVARCHALDRALMWGHYMIPLFYLGKDMIAHATEIKRPETVPVYGIVIESFWHSAEK